jgi:hypothetical protein
MNSQTPFRGFRGFPVANPRLLGKLATWVIFWDPNVPVEFYQTGFMKRTKPQFYLISNTKCCCSDRPTRNRKSSYIVANGAA